MRTDRGVVITTLSTPPAGSGPGDSSPPALSVEGDEPVGNVQSVLRIPTFRRLFIALSISSLGDWLGLLATTALAQQLGKGYSAKAYAIAAVLGVRLVPSMLFGPLAGALADRLDRRKTMVICDSIRCGLFISIPLVHTLWWLLASSFLIESASLLWIPAKEATVPNLVPHDRLEAANQISLFATYGSAAPAALLWTGLSLLTRALTGVSSFISANPVSLALFADAGTFAFSAMTVFSLRAIKRAHREPTDEPQSLIRSIREGLSFVRHEALIRGLVIGILGGFAGAGVVIALGRLYVTLLHGGDAAYGLLFGAVFVGLAGGIAGGPRLLGSYSRRRMFGIAVTGAGAALAVVAVLPNLVLSLFFILFVGAFAGLAWVTGLTLLGREVADEMRGRTFALVQSLARLDLLLVLTVAPVVVGLIGKHYLSVFGHFRIRADGVTIVLLAGGILTFVVGLVSYRQMDDRPGVAVLPEIWAALRGKYLRPAVPPHPGRFIALEGGEGAGKSTQQRLLAEWLRGQGFEVVVTREPGDTTTGQRLRELLLDPSTNLSPHTEALLYAADRAEHVARLVRPALERGAIVVSDRYVDSSVAYQGYGRGLDPETIMRMSRWATDELLPDLTILLDLPAEDGLARAETRRAGQATDRLEAEAVEFHTRVRAGFLRLAKEDPPRYVRVDASQAVEAVATQVQAAVAAVLPKHGQHEANPEAAAHPAPSAAAAAEAAAGSSDGRRDADEAVRT